MRNPDNISLIIFNGSQPMTVAGNFENFANFENLKIEGRFLINTFLSYSPTPCLTSFRFHINHMYLSTIFTDINFVKAEW